MTTLQKPRISDQSLFKKTGKTWSEWFQILNDYDAKKLTHKKIVEYLHNNMGVEAWWAQGIALQYELFHGLRERYQKCTGMFEVSITKTYNSTVEVLYNIWMDELKRKKWLSEPIQVRKNTPLKSIRVTWLKDATHLSVEFYEKSENKTQMVVQHSKLNSEQIAQVKLFWKEKLQALKSVVDTN